jgi:hypothetical protein
MWDGANKKFRVIPKIQKIRQYNQKIEKKSEDAKNIAKKQKKLRQKMAHLEAVLNLDLTGQNESKIAVASSPKISNSKDINITPRKTMETKEFGSMESASQSQDVDVTPKASTAISKKSIGTESYKIAKSQKKNDKEKNVIISEADINGVPKKVNSSHKMTPKLANSTAKTTPTKEKSYSTAESEEPHVSAKNTPKLTSPNVPKASSDKTPYFAKSSLKTPSSKNITPKASNMTPCKATPNATKATPDTAKGSLISSSLTGVRTSEPKSTSKKSLNQSTLTKKKAHTVEDDSELATPTKRARTAAIKYSPKSPLHSTPKKTPKKKQFA